MEWKQAERALSNAGGGFSFFGGREDKYQNAVDMFVQAANAFKMQQQRTLPVPMALDGYTTATN